VIEVTMAGGRLRAGDAVTVFAGEGDPYVLQFQRYAVVSRAVDEGYYVVLDATIPPDQEFGPFPAARLERGWRDHSGRWRAP
jgi:hypothetical protein